MRYLAMVLFASYAFAQTTVINGWGGGGGGGAPSGAAGGDLRGTYPNPGVSKILGNTFPDNGSGCLSNNGSGSLTWAACGGSTVASTSSVLKGDGSGGAVAATSNADFLPATFPVVGGASSADAASLGPELTSGTGWTSTGWTGSYAAGFTNGAGNTSTLSFSVPGMANGNEYQLVFVVSGRTTGSMTVSIGSTALQPLTPWAPTSSQAAVGSNGTFTFGPAATGSGALTFTPTSDFNGTVGGISVKLITAISSIPFRVNDSAGSFSNSISAIKNSLHSQFFGNNGGRFTTTGAYNYSIGWSALQSNTTGSNNIGIGGFSLSSNTIGNGNIAVGQGSLQNNTNGFGGTAIGYTALNSNTTGSNNTAVGADCLQSNTSGYLNSCLGVDTLISNTTGYSNAAFGTDAMNGMTTGFQNTAIGTYALFQNTTGQNNTAVGYAAGDAATGSGNVFIGYQAGYNESGSNKLYISNSNTATPLIGGDFNSSTVTINGALTANGTPIPASTTIQSVLGGTADLQVTASATTYAHPIGYNSAFNVTYANRAVGFPVSGTLSNFCFSTNSTQNSSGSLVATVYVNGSATSIVATVPLSGTSGVYCDTSHTASVSAQQTVAIQFLNNANVSSTTILGWTFIQR